MGCTDDEFGCSTGSEKATPVTLTRSFEIQQFELTRGEWQAFSPTDPTSTDGNGAEKCTSTDCPVVQLTWFEGAAYANWLSDRHDPALPHCYDLVGCKGEIGEHMVCDRARLTAPTIYECLGYRMPSEPEWEYAARAGTTSAFYGGAIEEQANFLSCESQPALIDDGWYCSNSSGQTHPVGMKVPNAFGLFDTEGNVFEMVQNPYAHGYAQFSPTDPDPEDETTPVRVTKGGLWNTPATASRLASHLDYNWLAPGPGVRLARTLGLADAR